LNPRPRMMFNWLLTRDCALLCTLLLVTGCGDPVGPDMTDPAYGRVQAGMDFTCALSTDRDIWCWGGNSHGQLGLGDTDPRLEPTRIAFDRHFKSVSTDALARHTCAVSTDGDAFCWGENDFGELGIGALDERSTPSVVVGGLEFESIGAGWRFSCGLTVQEEAYCWGRGEWGQLGDGRATQSLSPVRVSGGLRFKLLAVGANNLVCGLTVNGLVYCWGLDFNGSLGMASEEQCTRSDGFMLACATTPARIASDQSFTTVATGNSFACAVTDDGQALCWGANDSGQLGTATSETCDDGNTGESIPCSHTPVAVAGALAFRALSAGIGHTCGVVVTGEAYCWGANQFGERGDGLVGNLAPEPVAVRGGISFLSVSAGSSHSCGESTNRLFYCWGANDLGQLGTGNREIGLVPMRVLGTL
jgi:alpha-tubulin suppressor-like RCC1 family protein